LSTTREFEPVMPGQIAEHVGLLQALLADAAPPPVSHLKRAIAATRALRGQATLAGHDILQAYLARVFQLLEDVDSGRVPWSARVESALRAVIAAELPIAERLGTGAAPVNADEVEQLDGALVAMRGGIGDSEAGLAQHPSLAAPLPADMEQALQQIQWLRQALQSQAIPVVAREGGMATLEREIAMLQEAIRSPNTDPAPGPKTAQEGLRNHCEGALRHLVEAAAQEVLDEARERGLRLGIRVTGALDTVDEDLGSALLELLAYLWSDCLEAQAQRGGAEIDTVLRSAEERLIVEIHDAGVGDSAWSGGVDDDDVLGRYAGLRRSRPLVEALHGLVEVEPEDMAGCRFRLALPLSTDTPHATVVRIGRHEIAIPSSAIAGVHDARAVRADFDAVGAFVEVGRIRVPILHLAFVLHDVSYDELVREQIVVVGSFERRAAIFASHARRSIVGRLTPEAQGLWAGTLETAHGVIPMLHVGALLGRCGPAEVVPTRVVTPLEVVAERGPAHVLVVIGAGAEREALQATLEKAGHSVDAVGSADEAWRVLEAGRVDVMVCDLRLPEMNAQQLAERRRITGRFQDLPTLLVLAHAGEQSHLVVQQLGAAAWISSPVADHDLLGAVERLVTAT
jgi:CheY-like chemotaxis protein